MLGKSGPLSRITLIYSNHIWMPIYLNTSLIYFNNYQKKLVIYVHKFFNDKTKQYYVQTKSTVNSAIICDYFFHVHFSLNSDERYFSSDQLCHIQDKLKP
jgi:hypothetical protein